MEPRNWANWAHIITSTRGQWLPGDARGFRNRDHRVHSSGDYRCPPPPDEHAGLRITAKARSTGVVVFDKSQQSIVVRVVAAKLLDLDSRPRAVACDAVHCHALLYSPGDAVQLFGRAKQAASHALRGQIPGRVWGGSSHVVRIRDESHCRTVIAYILGHHDQGAAVWDARAAQNTHAE